MKPRFHRPLCLSLAATAAGALTLTLALATSGSPQAPASEPAAPQPGPEGELAFRGTVAPPPAGGVPGYYLGLGSCLGSGCHAATEPRADARVLGNEYYTWLRKDPHQGAFDLLYNRRSEAIAGNLELAEPAWQADLCLDCHAANVPAEQVAGALDAGDGIPCESCHGPASGWRDGHTDPAWEHADSVAQGLADQRDLSLRAEGCLACHLGDEERGVDHALIAAGHPILIFELDNYSQEMPPHWKPNPTHGAPAWAVGQAVAFRAGLAQLARRARSGPWPEFSELSCYSCHHSLKDDRWQEAGRYRRRVRPGLPPWSPARWLVLRHVVAAVAPGEVEGLGRDVRALGRAVERLNAPGEVAELASRAAAALDRVIPAVEAAAWNRRQVEGLLQALAADPEIRQAADVHSAEQAFFAAQTLASYLLQEDPRSAAGPLPGHLDSLYRSLADQESFDRARFAELLAAVAAAGRGEG